MPPSVSALIYLLSAALIVVDFNYLRKHGTEDDAIWLATGIFVSIVNIFVSLLNIFSAVGAHMESSSATTPTPEEQKARKAAELRGAPFLVYREEKGAQKIVELDENARTLTVGRRFEADIALPWDREVSRLHAQFEFKAGEWTVDDDGWSQNGTFVNEMRLDGQRRLQDGDIIRCGQTNDRVRPHAQHERRDRRWCRASCRPRRASRCSSSRSCASCARRCWATARA